MHSTTPDHEELFCECGRPRAEAMVSSYAAHSGHYLFHRCDCGAEWTDQLDEVDSSEPVSPDEVLEVHQRLAAFEGSFVDLFGGVRPAT